MAGVDPRIIPARAGFTRRSLVTARAGADHPRSRGVYDRLVDVCVTVDGSSPLARGLQGDMWARYGYTRIIPARAGFTCPRMFLILGCWDHPRSRGVYTVGVHSITPFSGSSPLARGLHRAGADTYRRRGIIPARAGFTVHVPTSRPDVSDHPRSRGVYVLPNPRAPIIMGSSPLARGLPARCL